MWVVASDLDRNVGPLSIGVGIDAGVLMIVWVFLVSYQGLTLSLWVFVGVIALATLAAMVWAATVWRSRWRATARGVGLGLLIIPIAIGTTWIINI